MSMQRFKIFSVLLFLLYVSDTNGTMSDVETDSTTSLQLRRVKGGKRTTTTSSQQQNHRRVKTPPKHKQWYPTNWKQAYNYNYDVAPKFEDNAWTQCARSTSCRECLTEGCSWATHGMCVPECIYIPDEACYTGDVDIQCSDYEAMQDDVETCIQATSDCETCTGTQTSSGEPCVWTDHGNGFGSCLPYCGFGGECDSQECSDLPGPPEIAGECQARNCADCVSEGCGWTGLICISDCGMIGGAAPCYQGDDAAGVCEEAENAEATGLPGNGLECQARNCADCVSEGCGWTGLICISDCGMIGGAAPCYQGDDAAGVCEEIESPGVRLPGTGRPGLECQARNCADCVSDGCGWTGLICISDCGMIGGAGPCYQGDDADGICEEAENLGVRLPGRPGLKCQARNCADCVSEGCGWTGLICISDCGMIGGAGPCYQGDDADGICEEAESPAVRPPGLPGLECQAMNCADCVSEGCGWTGQICVSDCGMLGGAATCYQGDDAEGVCEEQADRPEAPGLPRVECEAMNCFDCLSEGCGWTGFKCISDCGIIEGTAPCYEGDDAEGICEEIESPSSDAVLCNDQKTCDDCAATMKTEGNESCHWLDFGDGFGFCQSVCTEEDCGNTSCSGSP